MGKNTKNTPTELIYIKELERYFTPEQYAKFQIERFMQQLKVMNRGQQAQAARKFREEMAQCIQNGFDGID